MKAIETHYAGHRFRSRLEARWAVFLDHLGISWQYEPEGLSVSYRLSLAEGRFPYLPDFWLPEQAMWIEVKGSLTDGEMRRLLEAAAALSSNDGGGCHDSGGSDVVVLGQIPPHGSDLTPVRLHMHKGDLQAAPWLPLSDDGGTCYSSFVTVATDWGGEDWINWREDRWPKSYVDITGPLALERTRDALLNGLPGVANPRVRAAYTAARKARFEHGESG